MNIFANKTILITGGFGFIGSHLVRRLIELEAKVTILTKSSNNQFRLQDVLEKIKYAEIDICQTEEVNLFIQETKPDFVFHLASYGVNSAHSDYYKATYTNVIGSVNLLHALCKLNCQKFINIGSCAEYGNRKAGEQLAPVTIYGSTKAAATLILHQIAQENNIPIVTFRPFGVFGEGEEPHKIFSHIILNVLRGNDVKLTNCEQYRDYCYVENLIDAMLLACENDAITNEIFDIASGNNYPLKYYVEQIFKQLNTEKKPLYGDVSYRNVELWNPQADMNKIKTMLHWELKIPLEEGIQRTIEWYKKNQDRFPA